MSLPDALTPGTREYFLAERSTMIGGSDAHHLIGADPQYSCVRQLWYDKSGIPADDPFDVTGPIRRGIRLEDVAVEYYQEKTGRQVVKRPKAIRHPAYSFLGVHIDREIVAWEDDDGPGTLEVKTVGKEMYWQLRKEGLPERYIVQLQWGMGITSHRWGQFVVYWPDGDELLHFPHRRNERLVKSLFEAGVYFWPRVASGDAPERLRDDAEPCTHCRWAQTCQGAHMSELLARWKDREVRSDSQFRVLAEDYIQAKACLDQAEELMGDVKERFKQAMGEDLEANTPPVNGDPGCKVLYRPLVEWDEERLAADHPDVYAACTTPKLNGEKLAKDHPELEATYKTKPRLVRQLNIYPREERL